MKKIIAIFLAAATLTAMMCATTAYAASNGPDVRVNGELVSFPDAQPYVDANSRTYVPIRFVAEALGAYVDYSSTYQTVHIHNDVLTAEEIAMLREYDYTQLSDTK